MRPPITLILSFFLYLLGDVVSAQTPQRFETTRLQAKTFVTPGKRPATLHYLFYLPPAYQTNSTTSFPLMLFLHGAGERGTNVFLVSRHGPPKLVREGRDFPFILVAPQYPPDQNWDDVTLMVLLHDVETHYRVDTRRVYLTGISMGGGATWNFGLQHPEHFAAIVPICGGTSVSLLPRANSPKLAALKSLGIWVFHGAKDPIISVTNSENMVAALKELGCNDVTFTKYPRLHHDSWTTTYNNPALYDWLLAHHRDLKK